MHQRQKYLPKNGGPYFSLNFKIATSVLFSIIFFLQKVFFFFFFGGGGRYGLYIAELNKHPLQSAIQNTVIRNLPSLKDIMKKGS